MSNARIPMVDTDVWIDFLRGTKQALTFVDQLPHRVAISSISIGELYAGVRDGVESDALSNLLDTLDVLELNRDIAQSGGLIRRDFGKSHGVGLNDALIAATAAHCNACLYTLNLKHYPSLGAKQVLKAYRKS